MPAGLESGLVKSQNCHPFAFAGAGRQRIGIVEHDAAHSGKRLTH